MVALDWVGDAAAAKERAPQEGRPAALVLQHGEVDVEHQILPGIIAQRIDNMVQLLLL